MSEAMNVNSISSSQDKDNNNNIMKLEMRNIIMNLKAHLPNPKKVSYIYYVMCVLSEVGIARQAEVVKAITQVQNILNKIIGNINELEKLLREIQNQGWGYDSKGNKYDPSKHSKDQNKTQMENQIIKWMKKKSNIKGLTNAQALQYTWKQLYGTGKGNDTGLMGQLKNALDNPIYKQQEGSGYKQVSGWNQSGSPIGGHDWSWTTGWDGKSWQNSFLDFLKGNADITGGACALAGAFCSSYYNQTGTTPNDETGTKYPDTVGNFISRDLEMGKQTLNGLNSTESADLSMYSQNIISMIQEGEQMIKYGGQETQQYVSNQKPQ